LAWDAEERKSRIPRAVFRKKFRMILMVKNKLQDWNRGSLAEEGKDFINVQKICQILSVKPRE
jgi:hypothetical protein